MYVATEVTCVCFCLSRAFVSHFHLFSIRYYIWSIVIKVFRSIVYVWLINALGILVAELSNCTILRLIQMCHTLYLYLKGSIQGLPGPIENNIVSIISKAIALQELGSGQRLQ